MAGTSVDGLVSGMDTTNIIAQLMQLERLPVGRLEQQRTKASTIAAAYQAINTRFSNLQSIADKVTKADFWQARTATSTSTSVSAAAGVNAMIGSFSFDVEFVAAAQSYVSAGTFSSMSASVTTSSSITITQGTGTPVTVDVGTGSLADVVAGINASAAGVKAAAAQVSAGVFRLQLISSTTGAASDFTIIDGVDTEPLGALDELVAARDAQIAVGEALSPGRYTVTSASNTFAEIMPGVTLTVKAPATGVTVEVQPDTKTIADQVEGMVSATNTTLADIKKLTAFNPTTKTGSILTGDSVARQLQQDILRLASSLSGDSSAASVGIELNRDGTLKFDRAKFETAFKADPVATAGRFRPGGVATHVDPAYTALAGTISFLAAGDQAVPGAYDVKITAAGRQARVRVTGLPADGDTLTITVPGTTPLEIVAEVGDGLAELTSKINAASTTSNLGLVATVEAGELQVRTVGYGVLPTLAIVATGGLAADPVVAGQDVAGTINGVAAVGTGQVLAAPAETHPLYGLSLLVTATDADVATAAAQVGANQNLFGAFGYQAGLAQRFDSLAGDAVRTGTGRLSTAIEGRNLLAESLTEQIDAWDQRLALREKSLRRTYANLEVSLGKLRSQSNWLAGQLAGLSSGTAS